MYVITYLKETLTPPSKHITFMQIATPGQCEIVQKLDFNVLLTVQGHFRVKKKNLSQAYIHCAHFQIFSIHTKIITEQNIQ